MEFVPRELDRKPPAQELNAAQVLLLQRFPRIPRQDLDSLSWWIVKIATSGVWTSEQITAFWFTETRAACRRRFNQDPLKDLKWNIAKYPPGDDERSEAVFETLKPLIRNILRSWASVMMEEELSAPWQHETLRDRDTSEDTLQKTRIVLDLFPRLFEEAAAVAQYFLRSPATPAKVEAAVVEYAKEEYTGIDHISPSFWDLVVIPEFRAALAHSNIDAHDYAVASIGQDWRIVLRRWLPREITPPEVNAFWSRHRLEVMEFDLEFEAALDRYRTLYPQGGTANALFHHQGGRLPVQAPPTIF